MPLGLKGAPPQWTWFHEKIGIYAHGKAITGISKHIGRIDLNRLLEWPHQCFQDPHTVA